MTIQKLAKWISWLCCAVMSLILLVTICGVLLPGRIDTGALILSGIAAVQLFSMLSKRYVAAFRIASVELAIPVLLLFFPYPPESRSLPHTLPFKLTPLIWLFGGLALTTAIWICYKAAKDIKYASRNQNVNQQNVLNYGIKEYFRPWKLAAFATGLALLIGGSIYYRIPGWDIDNSLLTATLTYITAPWVIYMVKSWQWRKLMHALFAYVLFITSYTWCNEIHFNRPPLDAKIADAYFYVFSLLYLLCGLIGSQRMTLRELLSKLADTVHLRAIQTPLTSRFKK